MRLAHRRLFLSQLATLFDSGVPVIEALDSLSGSGPADLRACAMRLRGHVAGGDGLAAALARPPRAFPAGHVAAIEAGEAAGKVVAVLHRIVEEIDREIELREELTKRLRWPLFTALVAIVLLPLVTIVLRGVVVYLTIELVLLLPVVALVCGALWLSKTRMASPALAVRVDSRLGQLPLAGAVIRNISLGRSLRLFGILVEAGLPLATALPLVVDSCGLIRVRGVFNRVRATVDAGGTVTEGFQRSREVPDIAQVQIRTGEKSGTLDSALQAAGDRVLEVAWARLDAAAKVVPVIIILGIGLVVGTYAVLGLMATLDVINGR